MSFSISDKLILPLKSHNMRSFSMFPNMASDFSNIPSVVSSYIKLGKTITPSSLDLYNINSKNGL